VQALHTAPISAILVHTPGPARKGVTGPGDQQLLARWRHPDDRAGCGLGSLERTASVGSRAGFPSSRMGATDRALLISGGADVVRVGAGGSCGDPEGFGTPFRDARSRFISAILCCLPLENFTRRRS
jgi:hypothetical protein